MPCDFDVNIKALAFSKTQTTDVSVVRGFPRTARTHAACVSLSFFYDFKERGGFSPS
jgi:hypothetical protein